MMFSKLVCLLSYTMSCIQYAAEQLICWCEGRSVSLVSLFYWWYLVPKYQRAIKGVISSNILLNVCVVLCCFTWPSACSNNHHNLNLMQDANPDFFFFPPLLSTFLLCLIFHQTFTPCPDTTVCLACFLSGYVPCSASVTSLPVSDWICCLFLNI